MPGDRSQSRFVRTAATSTAKSSPTTSALTRPSLTNCCAAAKTHFAQRRSHPLEPALLLSQQSLRATGVQAPQAPHEVQDQTPHGTADGPLPSAARSQDCRTRGRQRACDRPTRLPARRPAAADTSPAACVGPWCVACVVTSFEHLHGAAACSMAADLKPSSLVELYRAAIQHDNSDQDRLDLVLSHPDREICPAAGHRWIFRWCANLGSPGRSQCDALPRRRPGGACDVPDGRRGGKAVIPRAAAACLTLRCSKTAEGWPLSASSVHVPRCCATA